MNKKAVNFNIERKSKIDVKLNVLNGNTDNKEEIIKRGFEGIKGTVKDLGLMDIRVAFDFSLEINDIENVTFEKPKEADC